MPSIIRIGKKSEQFTIVSNTPLRDPKLSLEAVGLLVWLLSHREGWKTSERSICKHHGIGRDRSRRILSELEEGGYLERDVQSRQGGGKFGSGVWEVTDQPVDNPQELTVDPLPDHGYQDQELDPLPVVGFQDHKERTIDKKNQAKDPVRQIFDYWVTATGNSTARLSDDKRRIIKERLRDKFTVDELKQAIDGCCNSPFHMGANDANRKYDGLHTIFENVTKVETFMRMAGPASATVAFDPNRQRRSEIQAECLAGEITEIERDRQLEALEINA